MQINIQSLLLGIFFGTVATYAYFAKKKREIGNGGLTIEAIIHELKTPLTGLSWIFATLEDLKTGEPINDDIITLFKEGKQKTGNALELTNDALVALNTSSSYTAYKFTNQDLVAVVNKVIDENSLGAKEKSITVEFKKDKDVEPLNFDEIKLGLALRNLLNNSIKYNHPGGHVTIETKRIGNDMTVSFSDDGIGIPSSETGKIFNKFYRAGNIGNISGSGLGLYIVKNIVTGHGGRIDIQSNEGKGTKITIFLPIKK